MSITSQGGHTPVADKYRAYVLAGLDQLETQVAAAGSIESFVRGEAPGSMRAQILWDGENLSVTPSIVSELILSGPGITTEVGTIQLAEWWEWFNGLANTWSSGLSSRESDAHWRPERRLFLFQAPHSNSCVTNCAGTTRSTEGGAHDN